MNVKRKYSVFISSSFKDLREIRTEIVKEILKIGHIPVGMELFRAGNEKNLSLIEREIKDCDIFILLVGSRLGTKVSLDKKSTFTEWEYSKACELGKPTFVFLVNNAEYAETRSKIPMDDPEREHDKALNEFRDRVQQITEDEKRIVEFFSYKDISDIRGKVANVISLEVQNLDHGGWVRGNVYDVLQKRVILNESASVNPFFVRFAKHFNEYQKLSQKTRDEAQLKNMIGEYIWDILLHTIALKNVSHLYFDSGSSIAYLTQRLIDKLATERWFTKKLEIYTSNLLTYLDFTLMDPHNHPSVSISLLPEAPVESSYGSTYGDFLQAIKFTPPKDWCALHEKVRPFIDNMREKLINSLTEKSIIFMAASGLETRFEVEFRGPHVGSYYNQLVKRSLLETGLPTILVLDETKFHKSFIVGKCYPVCGPEFEWDNLIKNNPFAIALATNTQEKLDSIVEELSSWGLDSSEPITGKEGVWPIVASNRLFKNFLD